MTRHYRVPTKHPETGRLGYWFGDTVGGEIVDRWADACQYHPVYDVPCDRCAELEYRPTTEGPDATRPG